jgi:hypothetical protein
MYECVDRAVTRLRFDRYNCRKMLYNLPENHLGGRVFFGLVDQPIIDPDAYFRLVPTVKPLFSRDDFAAATPGFYINYIRDPDVPNGALRLNYFTVDASQTIDSIDSFVQQAGVLAVVRTEHADRTTPLDQYDEGRDKLELNFRNFLDANTRICLDMLENFGPHSFESLVAAYRFILLPQRIRPEDALEEYFAEHSETFNQLRDSGLGSIFWNDLVHVHRGRDVGLHFLVNMVALPDGPYKL